MFIKTVINSHPPWSRHWDRIRQVKDGLTETPVKEDRQEDQKEEELWDHDAGLTPQEGEREGSPRLEESQIAERSWENLHEIHGESPSKASLQSNSVLCRSGLAPRHSSCSERSCWLGEPTAFAYRLGATHGQHGWSIWRGNSWTLPTTVHLGAVPGRRLKSHISWPCQFTSQPHGLTFKKHQLCDSHEYLITRELWSQSWIVCPNGAVDLRVKTCSLPFFNTTRLEFPHPQLMLWKLRCLHDDIKQTFSPESSRPGSLVGSGWSCFPCSFTVSMGQRSSRKQQMDRLASFHPSSAKAVFLLIKKKKKKLATLPAGFPVQPKVSRLYHNL